jgi:hypothetical protein
MAIDPFELCIKPNPTYTVWRYMNLDKFESILKNEALFFCRADRFSDPFEGSIPKREAEYRIEERRKISNYYGKEFDPSKAKKSIKSLSNLHIRFKKQHVVNCWHTNNHENDLMWRLYLDSNEGIAIKTTVGNLIKSFLATEESINISNVRYLNYETDIWYDAKSYPLESYNMFVPLVHKRIEFKHEEEIRLIHSIKTDLNLDEFWDSQPHDSGINISVNVNTLIDEIYTPPTCDDKQIIKVQNILDKYKFNFKIFKSGLTNNPYY